MKIHATTTTTNEIHASDLMFWWRPPTISIKYTLLCTLAGDAGMLVIHGNSKVVSHQQLFLLSALFTFRRGERGPPACGRKGGH